jgi:hypothetical protein
MENIMKRALEEGLVLVAGAGLGLAAMYLLDPESGSHRRGAISHATRTTIGGIGHSLSHVGNAISHGAGNALTSAHDAAASAAQSLTDTAHDLLPPHSQSSCAMSAKIAATAGGGVALFAIGAGLAYLFDPDRGRMRRAYLHDQVYSFVNRGENWMGKKQRHLRNRAQGVYAKARRSAMGANESDQPAVIT